MDFLFVLILLIVCLGGGWLIGKFFGMVLFGDKQEKTHFHTTNIHYHNHSHEHKNITVIDEETKQKIIEWKESKENKD